MENNINTDGIIKKAENSIIPQGESEIAISDDEDNSWADELSGAEDEEQDDPVEEDYYGEEEEIDSKQKQLLELEKSQVIEELKTVGAKKITINVYCTEYDVVKKVAKKVLDFKLKEIEEDHEGAVYKGQGGGKLSLVWDISWHDLAISPDYMTKMQPY